MARSGTLTVRVIGDTKDFQSKLGGATDKVKAFAKTAALAGVGVAAAFGVKAVKSASDLQQSVGAVKSVFGDAAGKIREFGSTADTQFGLSQRAVNETAAVLGASLQSMGFEADETADQVISLQQRAADMAATFGGTTTDALDAVASLMRGERDPIERYGVAIKQADVNARLAAQGLGDLEGEAKTQAEAQAALALLFEQTANVEGQFAKESDTLAGAQARLGAKFENVAAKIGEELLPHATKLAEFALRLIEDWGPEVEAFLEKAIPKAIDAAAEAFDVLAGGIEWVRKNSEWLLPVVGGLATAFALHKAVLFATSAASKAAAAATWLLNVALAANPIGIVVLALAGLVAAFVIAWNTSETFRDKVAQVWEAVLDATKRLGANVVEGIQWIVDKILGFVETVIGAAAEAFGWVPGIGEKLKGAAEQIKEFRKKTNDQLSQIQTELRFSADITPAMRELFKLQEAARELNRAGFNVAVPGIGSAATQVGGVVMHSGGIVPGRPGQEVPAILEAGETVIPRGVGVGGHTTVNYNVTVNAPNYVGSHKEFERAIVEALARRAYRTGSALYGIKGA